MYQFTLSGGRTDKEDEVFGTKGGERSSRADMWCPRRVCSDTAVICSRWRKVALKAVSVNEITWAKTQGHGRNLPCFHILGVDTKAKRQKKEDYPKR